jgi:hypothetical protein
MAKRPNLQAFFLPCLQRMENRSPTAELSLAQASRPVRRSSKSEASVLVVKHEMERWIAKAGFG